MKTIILQFIAVIVVAVAGANAYAGEETLDIDTHFRAKLAKEKVKQEFQERRAAEQSNGNDNASPSCGSQSIGNVDTNGRIGTAPREVFVFAPNAINLVTANGCH